MFFVMLPESVIESEQCSVAHFWFHVWRMYLGWLTTAHCLLQTVTRRSVASGSLCKSSFSLYLGRISGRRLGACIHLAPWQPPHKPSLPAAGRGARRIVCGTGRSHAVIARVSLDAPIVLPPAGALCRHSQ